MTNQQLFWGNLSEEQTHLHLPLRAGVTADGHWRRIAFQLELGTPLDRFCKVEVSVDPGADLDVVVLVRTHLLEIHDVVPVNVRRNASGRKQRTPVSNVGQHMIFFGVPAWMEESTMRHEPG